MSTIWENTVGRGMWKVKIDSFSEEVMNRGILKIYSLDDQLMYQVEVPVDRKLKFGGTVAHMQKWTKVIEDWIANSSPSRPPAALPLDPQE